MKKNLVHEVFDMTPLIHAQLKKSKQSTKGQKVFYGSDREQYYILKKPKVITKRKLMVYIHGGGFRFSSAQDHNFIGDFFLKRGYVSVNLCYRKVPKHRYPSLIDDIFMALRQVLDQLHSQGLRFEEIVINGSSAGGYLGAMLCFDTHRQQQYQLRPEWFKGLCSLSGALNINYNSSNWLYKKFMDDFFKGAQDSPLQYVRNNPSVNLLVMHGVDDPLVPFKDTKRFYDLYPGNKTIIPIEGKLHCKVCIAPFLECEEVKAYEAWLKTV